MVTVQMRSSANTGPPDRGIRPLYIQAYDVVTEGLRSLDSLAPECGDFAHGVFDWAELCGVDGLPGPDDLTFPRLIARLVRAAGYDGMVVPGVRGARGFWYSNLVMFFPEESWERWSLRDRGFVEVGGDDSA